MKSYTDFFIKQQNFSLKLPPKIVTFDDKSLAGGYWDNDTFYLNISSYNETNKYETSSLILHETITGHHLQLSNMIHMNKTNMILYSWFPKFINGNCEGWGLFAEQLGHDMDNFSYMGVMSMHLLRTLRVIADISIHYYKVDPEKLITLFKYYLPIPHDIIESEIYRYVSVPGQALCYKLGYEIIKRIFYKKFNRNNKLLDNDAIEFYKEFIKCIIPLDILCKKYNVSNKF